MAAGLDEVRLGGLLPLDEVQPVARAVVAHADQRPAGRCRPAEGLAGGGLPTSVEPEHQPVADGQRAVGPGLDGTGRRGGKQAEGNERGKPEHVRSSTRGPPSMI